MQHNLTNKDAWLKLFQNNDTALIAAITLCERFVNDKELNDAQLEFINNRKKWLYQSADDNFVSIVDEGTKTISVQEYNEQVYPLLNNATCFISNIDHALQKSDENAQMQFRVIGWNEETKQFILNALEESRKQIKKDIR